jgi:hypothetical protein
MILHLRDLWLLIPIYYVGLYLGDGKVKDASVSGSDPEIIACLRSLHIRDFSCDHRGRNSQVTR